MPLNAAERTQLSQSFLKCFGEDSAMCGRTARFMSDFTVGTVNILASILNAADTWQPFLESGLEIPAWKAEVTRIYNLTQTT